MPTPTPRPTSDPWLDAAPLEGEVHLLPADDALAGGIGGIHVAICGELVPWSRLPRSSCPPDCDCAVYCPECVRVIACWHAETAQARTP